MLRMPRLLCTDFLLYVVFNHGKPIQTCSEVEYWLFSARMDTFAIVGPTVSALTQCKNSSISRDLELKDTEKSRILKHSTDNTSSARMIYGLPAPSAPQCLVE